MHILPAPFPILAASVPYLIHKRTGVLGVSIAHHGSQPDLLLLWHVPVRHDMRLCIRDRVLEGHGVVDVLDDHGRLARRLARSGRHR